MKSDIRGDTYMYVSQLYHPATHEQLVDLNQLKQILDDKIGHALLRYAYIVHDHDTVTESDVAERDNIRQSCYNALRTRSDASFALGDAQTAPVSDADIHAHIQSVVDAKYPSLTLGQSKPPHLHLVLRLSTRRYRSEIANWFTCALDTSPWLFKIFSDSRGQSRRELNAMRYLVHASQPNKYRYDYSAVTASFDFESDLVAQSQLAKEREKYDMERNDVRDYVNAIASNSKTRLDFIAEHSYAMYQDYQRRIDDAEERRHAHSAIPLRITGYIGTDSPQPGGLGKTSLGLALSTVLALKFYHLKLEDFPSFAHLKTVNPFFHNAPAMNMFEGYRSQPIMLCNDFTANTFKASFRDGLSGVKDFLDIHPFLTLRNVKGSMTLPFVSWILINGDDDWNTFFDSIRKVYGEKDDKVRQQVSQFARRFFFHVNVPESGHLTLYLNSRYYPIPFAEINPHEPGRTYSSVAIDDNGFFRACDYDFDWTALIDDASLSDSDKLKLLIDNIGVIVDDILTYTSNGSTWNQKGIVRTQS